MPEGIRDACGVFSIAGHEDASHLTYLGLYALQHRGQESAGIVTAEGEHPHTHIGMGLVADVFKEGDLTKLKGDRGDRPCPVFHRRIEQHYQRAADHVRIPPGVGRRRA